MTATLLVMLLLVACSQARQGVAPPPTPGAVTNVPADVAGTGSVEDFADVVEGLSSQDVTVEQAGPAEPAFFEAAGQSLRVNQQDVQVFEFDSADGAEAAAATVNRSGSSIGGALIKWADTPHFYHQGRVIVLYAGADPAVLEALEAVLGPQFAGG